MTAFGVEIPVFWMLLEGNSSGLGNQLLLSFASGWSRIPTVWMCINALHDLRLFCVLSGATG
jgi:hypothetical protein